MNVKLASQKAAKGVKVRLFSMYYSHARARARESAYIYIYIYILSDETLFLELPSDVEKCFAFWNGGPSQKR